VAAPSTDGLSNVDPEAIVAPYVADQRFSGAILIVRERQVVFDKAYGFADLAAKIPNATATSFHIGTLSAQFTRAAIDQLVSKQRLAWANTADQFVPEAPRITVRSLVDSDPSTPNGRDAYRLLARVAERASAKSFADVISTVAFGPLWLYGAGLDDGMVSAHSLAKGYVRGDAGALVPTPTVDWANRAGEGSAYLTTRDEFAWIQKQYGNMLSCRERGWEDIEVVVASEGCWTSSHGDGFASYVFFAPSHLAVIVLANVDTDAAVVLGRSLVTRFAVH
jgi:CubicO group peptidase (beta-lactamase class C family)